MPMKRLFAAAIVGLAAASFSYADRAEAATFTPFSGDIWVDDPADTIPAASTVEFGGFTWGRYSGNDCAGVLTVTQGFDCQLFGSPSLAKWDFDEDDDPVEYNTRAFPGLESVGFEAELNGEHSVTFSWNTSGSMTAPGVTAVAIKAGTFFYVLTRDDAVFLGDSFSNVVLNIPSGTGPLFPGISHITLYDTTIPIPLPAAAWMLLSALGGLGLLGFRRKQTA